MKINTAAAASGLVPRGTYLIMFSNQCWLNKYCNDNQQLHNTEPLIYKETYALWDIEFMHICSWFLINQ